MRESTKTIVLWALLIAMFLAIWQFLTPAPGARSRPEATDGEAFWSLGTGLAFAGFVLVILVIVALRRLNKTTAKAQAVGVAYTEALARGDHEAADAALDGAPRWPRAYALLADYQRAYVRYDARRFADGIPHLDRAARGGGILFRSQARSIVALSIARRAVLHAALDHEAEARADITASRGFADVAKNLVAPAAFAELVLLARKGDLAGLRDRIDGNDDWRGVTARELAIVRGLDAMARPHVAGAYRRRMDEVSRASAGGAFAAWAEALVPGVAPFVTDVPAKTEIQIALPETTAHTKSQIAKARDPKRAGRRPWRFFGFLYVGGLVGGVVLLGFAGAPGLAIGGAGVAWTAGALVELYRRAQRDAKIENRARELDVAGRPAEAERAALPLLRTTDDGRLAAAERLRAGFALHLGDAEQALAHCDAALAHVTRAELEAVKTAKQQPKLADLGRYEYVHQRARYLEIVATRAVVLAALGRNAEARAELSLLGELAPATSFAFELYRLARAGDASALADLADCAGLDLPASPFDDALLAAARAATGDGLALRWLERELRRAPAVTTFLEKLAPALLTRAKQGGSVQRDAATGSPEGSFSPPGTPVSAL